jgi:hypothetical protein
VAWRQVASPLYLIWKSSRETQTDRPGRVIRFKPHAKMPTPACETRRSRVLSNDIRDDAFNSSSGFTRAGLLSKRGTGSPWYIVWICYGGTGHLRGVHFPWRMMDRVSNGGKLGKASGALWRNRGHGPRYLPTTSRFATATATAKLPMASPARWPPLLQAQHRMSPGPCRPALRPPYCTVSEIDAIAITQMLHCPAARNLVHDYPLDRRCFLHQSLLRTTAHGPESIQIPLEL